jgi:hypothetical protein
MTRHARLTAGIALALLGALVWLGAPCTAQANGTKVIAGAGTPLGLHSMPPVPQPPPRPSWQPRPAPYPYAYSAPPVWPPGYWSYVWVPQVYTAWVLVPDGWAADGSWVDARYEPRTYEGGYYQQVWVGAVPSP